MYKNPLKIFLDRLLQALSDLFPGKGDTIQHQQLQIMFDHRVQSGKLSHTDIVVDPPRPDTLIPPSQSHQNEAPVSQEIARYSERLQMRKTSQRLLNRKFAQLIAQGCTTERFNLDASQKEAVRKVTDPLFHKTTFQPMVVEEDMFLNQLPITPESLPIFDPDETHKVPAIMKLKRGA